jgi:hypothetical protein
MGDDIYVGILEDTDQSRRELFSRLTQARVKGGDDDIETRQGLVVKIERSIPVNLNLRASQEFHPGCGIRFVNLDSL